MVKSNGTIGPLQVSSDTDSRKDGQYTNRDFREEAETGFPAVNSTDPMNRAGRRCSPVLRTYPSIRLVSHNSRSESHIQGKIQTFIPSPGEISTLVKNGSRQVTGKAYHEMDIRSWGKPDRERERKPGIHEERNGGDGECTPELNNSTENTRNKGKQNEGTRNKGKQNEGTRNKGKQN
ncbi:MAG: hypothetical protein ABEK59_10970, partial [Halobacteria archaeon]